MKRGPSSGRPTSRSDHGTSVPQEGEGRRTGKPGAGRTITYVPLKPRWTDVQREALHGMLVNVDRSGRYPTAVRDWVARGAASQYALTPSEVVERSRSRPMEFAMASAEFELAQHLHRAGHGRDAVPHFAEAHRLDPENWSYLRQAVAVADQAWGKVYDADMMSEVSAVGPETFYPPLDL
jgi:hypothetical protein